MSNITDNPKIQVLKAGCSGVFTNYIYKAIPLAFDESMSYYETLAGLRAYLKDVILPTVNGNAEAVAELQELYIQLNDYVTNYFDNLDVQEEINNKLDQMVEDGIFESILLNYTQITKVFDTYNDMMLDTSTYVNGMKLKTLGYHYMNDGGGADYVVTNVQNDNKYQVSIGTNLWIEMIIKDSVNVKQFGAKGDGLSDDTIAIQNAIDFGFSNGIDVFVPSTPNFYKITKPLLLIANFVENYKGDNWWSGNGTRLYGDYKARCRIIKIGNKTLINSDIQTIQNVNATLICYQDRGTGIYLDNLTLQNYNDEELTEKTEGSLALWSNVSRSTYKNLNINAYRGIFFQTVFSSLIDNIEFSCRDTVIESSNGTSNTFRFLYAHGCSNPFKISSTYSTLMNFACDNCTGTLYRLSGVGLKLLNCGCESRNAQYIIEPTSTWFDVTVDGMSIDRQIGNGEDYSIEDCAIAHLTKEGFIKLNNITIIEREHQEGTSYIFKLDENNTPCSTSINNILYIKNFTGANNKRMKIWNEYHTNSYVHHHISSGGIITNYQLVGEGQMLPYVGTVLANQSGTDNNNIVIHDELENIPSPKAIFFDCNGRYDISNNESMQYIANAQLGDLHLYNDPLQKGCLGLVTTKVISGQNYSLTPIPLILSGPSENRPTTRPSGTQYFDTTLNKAIWWNGSKWVDSSGNEV